MREQFEDMPEVRKKLKDFHPTIVWFSDQENKYASSFEGFQNTVIWLNGAWYIYQEQQKKIDGLNKHIEDTLNMLETESENSWKLWKEKADMYEQGAANAYERAYWILKGNE